MKKKLWIGREWECDHSEKERKKESSSFCYPAFSEEQRRFIPEGGVSELITGPDTMTHQCIINVGPHNKNNNNNLPMLMK